ncbi:hypothetical protein P8864_10300 [Priestia flexa]|uniref:hypothetical protein n=1 Tax=Priestia flexa TaxID=86664 RepID=UPI000C244ECC|nr:hypothetical protein [Priestia flexa]MEC0666279.1 hypothetical protein [Priestia flexa]
MPYTNGPDIYGNNYQMFITCEENGKISSSEYGQMIVRMEPADFFFLFDKSIGHPLQDNIWKYEVKLNGMRAYLSLKEEFLHEDLPRYAPEGNAPQEEQAEELTEEQPIEEPIN